MKNQKGFIQIIIILVVLALIGGAYYFGTKNKQNVVSEVPTASPTPTITTEPFSFPVVKSSTKTSVQCFNLLTKSPTKESGESNFGTIFGKVYYPSDGLPDEIKACAFNVDTDVRYCTPDFNQRNIVSYELKVPEGKYYVYSLAFGKMIGVGAPNKFNDYQSFQDKNGHQLGKAPLLIDVSANSKKENIDIGDDIVGEDELYCPDIK